MNIKDLIMTADEETEKQNKRKIEKRINNITKSLHTLQSSLNILTDELKNSPNLGIIEIPRGKPPTLTTLVTAEIMSQKLHNLVSEKTLLELAKSKIIPHYDIEDQIRFAITETKEWIEYNYVVRHPGQPIGEGLVTVVNVVSPSINDLEVPLELRAISNFLIPTNVHSLENISVFSGVYFLCHEGKVVYVGQSRHIHRRMGQHSGSKTYDFGYFIRVPLSDLDFVEKEFIRTLKPKYNFNKKKDRLVTPPVSSSPTPQEQSFTIIENFKKANNIT
jgi:hypothetical protein